MYPILLSPLCTEKTGHAETGDTKGMGEGGAHQMPQLRGISKKKKRKDWRGWERMCQEEAVNIPLGMVSLRCILRCAVM